MTITKKFRNGITNGMVTCITETDRSTNIKCSDELATVTDVKFSHITGKERLLTCNDLTALLILLA